MRLLRLGLTPLNFLIAITTPDHYCFLPLMKRGFLNMAFAVCSFHFAAKSLEWGMTGGYWEGKYWTRSHAKTSSTPATQVQSAAPMKTGWMDIAGWTTEQFFCLRGLQYGWGQKIRIESPRIPAVIQRIFLMNLLNTSSLAFLLMVRDQKSPALAEDIGIPKFRFDRFIAESLTTLAFGFLLISGTDMSISQMNIQCHVIHWLGKHVWIPEWILRSTDPTLTQPAFDSPYSATSLSWFWGRGWHQILRRDFLMCGGYPASTMARKLGGGLTTQKVCGLFGSFFVSALLHEYVVHHFAPESHPSPHRYLQEFPSSFAYFFVQPLGILLEPYIIPLIPRKMGGGWLWVLAFTLLTATPFRKQWIHDFRLIDDAFKPLKDWNMWTFLIPGLAYNI
ncbi:hypothetical protein DFH28DRAFT_1160874 [Melampsora americana]|nr:hypothetical protein DFH28DRAFT_1160874 [Melampsora americana]